MNTLTDTSLPLACQSLASLSVALESRQITSVELVTSCLARIELHEPKLKAFAEVLADSALAEAKRLDQLSSTGTRLGRLHGIPVAVKDAFAIRGARLGGGSRCRNERPSLEDSKIVAALRSCGMPILGRAQAVEFSYGGLGISNGLGTPWNPWDTQVQRIPGGSSSGSGVALAAGLVPAAIGSDTGGSVRLPASWCGLTALKVTEGLLPAKGILPLSDTLDTPGPMARSAIDAAMLFEAMGGAIDSTALGAARLDGLRLASLPPNDLDQASGDVISAYHKALEQLKELGAVIVERALPASLDEINELTGRIMAAEGYFNCARYIDDMNQPMDPAIRERMAVGRNISAHAYLSALHRRRELIELLHSTFDDCAAILSPTTPWTALPVSTVDPTAMSSYYTRFSNLLAMCAVALPIGRDAAGLPISMQIAAFGGRETEILGIAASYQAATAWHQSVPCLP